MLLDVAWEYIAMGDSLEEKQQYLNGAVSAWNIACLDPVKREKEIKRYCWSCRRLNPSQTASDSADMMDNMRKLISRKEELYPNVKVQIAEAMIWEQDGQYHVTVASVSLR